MPCRISSDRGRVAVGGVDGPGGECPSGGGQRLQETPPRGRHPHATGPCLRQVSNNNTVITKSKGQFVHSAVS